MHGRVPVAALAFASAAVFGLAHSPGRSQPGMMGRHGMGPGMGSMVRHHQAMMNGIPDPYRTARNPLPASPATLARGRQVYAENCATCHGPKGRGDGPAGQQLSPRPADIAWLASTHMAGDPYVYWTIAEGGQPVGSAMPAFKTVLKPGDIWAVVSFVRQGLPAPPGR